MRVCVVLASLFLTCLLPSGVYWPLAWAGELATVPHVPELPEVSVPGVLSEQRGEHSPFPLSLELKLRGYAQKHAMPSSERSVMGSELSGRVYGAMPLDADTSLTVNIKASTDIDEYGDYKARTNTHVAIQELALRHSFSPAVSITAGRSNIRGGVASGFSPTDWFKTDSLARTDSLDALDRREDRLGVVAFQGVYLTEGGLVHAGWRPKIATSSRTVLSNGHVVGLGLDRTNAADSLFLRFTPSWWANVSLTPSVYYEESAYGAGLETSMTATEHLVLYGEWAVKKRNTLFSEAAEQHQESCATTRSALSHQLAVGGTWALPEFLAGKEDVALSLEYHYNEAGLDTRHMQKWQRTHGHPAVHLLPKLAASYQEPLGQHQVFTRLTWNDIIKTSDLSLISTISLQDGSGFSQATWKIPLDAHLRLETQGYVFWGGDTRIYGSARSTLGTAVSIIYSF